MVFRVSRMKQSIWDDFRSVEPNSEWVELKVEEGLWSG